jgi:hypothetical protein
LLTARLIAAATVILMAGFLFGCGGGGESTGSDEAALPPSVVTESDIAAQPDGSPQRALLEWWQAYQFGDSEQVLERTSKSTIDKLGENDLSELVKSTGQGLQGVEVLGADETGSTASVRVGLLQFTPEKPGGPPPDEPTSSSPDTFEMEKQGDEWKFAATEFLEPKLDEFQQAQQQQEQTSTSKETTSTGG